MVALDLNWLSRQRIRDAALPIEVLRAQILPSVASNRAPDVRVGRFPQFSDEISAWVRERCSEADELIAVSHLTESVEQYRASFAFNAELVRRGTRMTSLFDVSGLADDVSDFLIAATDLPYFFAYGPTPIKVFDRKSVMLEGPPLRDGISVMVVSRPEFAAAAMRYVNTVREYAVPCRDFAVEDMHGLTQRQHAIARLLGDNRNDEAIAALLGISVRTVRQDVARLLEVLGASTRFSAGLRYARISSQGGAPPGPGEG